MYLSKWGYYADLVLYPILVLALILADFRSPHSHFLGVFMLCCVSGLAGWTFIEYATHRFVFHSIPAAAEMHELHHATPTAFVGTPSWLSLVAFALGGFIPLWAIGGWEIASGGVTGLMIGYVWYLVVHDAVHRWPVKRDAMLYNAKLRHAYHHHHAGQLEGNFGVTTGFWDRLLGTAIGPAEGLPRNP
jgi:sterol desaturase/sphingolipid hydroxylase (fatty acid hydroxylase superfamily)